VIALARIVVQLLADLAGLVVLSVRSRRIDAATRVSLALLSRLFDSGVPDPPSEVVPSVTPLTRHRLGERLGVRARSVLGGLHHEYLPAPALA
jgi:hypothetical protein